MKKKLLAISLIMNIILLVGLFIVGTGKHTVFLSKINPETTTQYSPRYLTRESIFEVKTIESPDAIFIGDSLTENNEWSEAFPNLKIYNRGIYGDGSKGLLDRINQVKDVEKTKVFVLIGVNDLANGIKREEIAGNFEKIATELQHHDLYFQSLIPVDKTTYPNVKSEDIIWLNEFLLNLSKKEKFQYIDLYSVFSDENDSLEKKWSYDGLHLNGEAYKVWEEKTQNYIEP